MKKVKKNAGIDDTPEPTEPTEPSLLVTETVTLKLQSFISPYALRAQYHQTAKPVDVELWLKEVDRKFQDADVEISITDGRLVAKRITVQY